VGDVTMWRLDVYDGGVWRDSGEGPFATREQVVRFAKSECGVPWRVRRTGVALVCPECGRNWSPRSQPRTVDGVAYCSECWQGLDYYGAPGWVLVDGYARPVLETDYYAGSTPCVLADMDAAELATFRNQAAYVEDWRTVDDIDRHVTETWKGALVRKWAEGGER
jgi:predicted RNA-binding Zn-ribbon protein involved in translation (DUF1610 family)